MKCFAECSAMPFDRLILLAQEGMALFFRIHNHHQKHCCHRRDQEHFHAHRIAWSCKSVLYSGFANAKQI
jgi:hypothetical protein